MTVVLVGQAPNQATRVHDRPGLALTGACGRFLADLAGLSMAAYLRRTERVNLLTFWPGKDGKGDAFPAPWAEMAAGDLRKTLGGRTVLLLGAGVARAFHVEHLGWMRWATVGAGPEDLMTVSVLPHPSRVNRWWNSPANRAQAREFLREVLK